MAYTLSAGKIVVEHLEVTGAHAGAIQAANVSFTNDLRVGGSITSKTSPKNKFGLTTSGAMYGINSPADLLKFPGHCRSLGITDLEIWHNDNKYYKCILVS